MAPIESPDPRQVVTFRMDSEQVEQLDQLADQNDQSRAELLRELAEARIAEYDPDPIGRDVPASERLRDAYLKLLDMADEPIRGAGLRVTRTEAENELYTNRTPKDSVMQTLIRPLKQAGFVEIDPGMHEVWIVVRPMRNSTERED